MYSGKYLYYHGRWGESVVNGRGQRLLWRFAAAAAASEKIPHAVVVVSTCTANRNRQPTANDRVCRITVDATVDHAVEMGIGTNKGKRCSDH